MGLLLAAGTGHCKRFLQSPGGMCQMHRPPVAAIRVEFLLNKIDDGRGGGHSHSLVLIHLTKHERHSSGSRIRKP